MVLLADGYAWSGLEVQCDRMNGFDLEDAVLLSIKISVNVSLRIHGEVSPSS